MSHARKQSEIPGCFFIFIGEGREWLRLSAVSDPPFHTCIQSLPAVVISTILRHGAMLRDRLKARQSSIFPNTPHSPSRPHKSTPYPLSHPIQDSPTPKIAPRLVHDPPPKTAKAIKARSSPAKPTHKAVPRSFKKGKARFHFLSRPRPFSFPFRSHSVPIPFPCSSPDLALTYPFLRPDFALTFSNISPPIQKILPSPPTEAEVATGTKKSDPKNGSLNLESTPGIRASSHATAWRSSSCRPCSCA